MQRTEHARRMRRSEAVPSVLSAPGRPHRTMRPVAPVALLAAFAALALSGATAAAAGTFAAYGPQDFTSSQGDGDDGASRAAAAPKTPAPAGTTGGGGDGDHGGNGGAITFAAPAGGAPYVLHIDNGGATGTQYQLVGNAVIRLNGKQVLGREAFEGRPRTIDQPVTLQASNRLEVQIDGGEGDDRGDAAAGGGHPEKPNGFRLMVLGTDSQPPSITAVITPPPNAAGWNKTNVTVSYQCADAVSGIAFCPPALTVTQEGAGQVYSATAADNAGNVATATVTLNIDKTPPVVVLTSPPGDQATNASSLAVGGSATDANPIVAVLIDGVTVATAQGSFSGTVTLQEGLNTVTATARDIAGNVSSAVLHLTRFTLPQLGITSPAPETLTSASTITVSGTLSPQAVAVDVNGIAGTITSGAFTAANVPVFEGNNTLTAVATDAAGRAATASVQVIRDSTPPRLSILSPAPGVATTAAAVDVSGIVNDLIIGTVAASEAAVTVNGQPAQVLNRNFLAGNVPLSPGANTLTVVATDPAGNSATASVTVNRASAVGQPRIAAVTGGLQSGTIGAVLPAPLVVQVSDASGNPLPGRTVLFQIAASNGSLLGNAGPDRYFRATTDTTGQAQVTWTLGTRSGAGNNRVEATSPGVPGVAVFTASGLPGAAAAISLDSGNRQYGVAGQPLPRPLVAVVTDAGHNRVAGVPVTFRVAAGGGSFAGAGSVTVATDVFGRALASLTLGPLPGIENNAVVSDIAGDTGAPVVFTATGQVAGNPSQTQISGVVLDDTNLPVPGVSLSIEETSIATLSNAQGQFTLGGAPVGRVRVIADGSTAQRPGSWPTLQYEMVTIAGQNNQIGMPIYLLPLDLPHGVFVDETHGGTVTIPGLPGFSLQIAPGSATFPGGGKSGTVSVTLVHADKVPMVPNFGQQPRFIVTVQPVGTRFDPPAPMTMPNIDGLAPGQVTEMYAFNHEMGLFVSIGTATVSLDGRLLRSDPGIGVVEAGWECGGNPQPAGGAQTASVSITSPKPQQLEKGKTATLTASGAPQPGTYQWSTDRPDVVSFQGGTDGSSVVIQAQTANKATVTVTFTSASGAAAQDQVTVNGTTQDITVVAFVDKPPLDIELAAADSQADFLIKSDLNGGRLTCNGAVGLWLIHVPVDLLSQADRQYANVWLLDHSSNSRPPATIDPTAIRNAGDYRLWNRLQVSIDDSGPTVNFIQQPTPLVGITPNPCGAFPPLAPAFAPGEVHPSNGSDGLTPAQTGAYQLNEGRIGSDGQTINQTINGHSTPWIWNVVRFDLAGNLQPADIDHQIFPTYYVYADGQLINVYPQAPSATFIAFDASSQRLPSDVP
jgi:Glucodextranase, domain B/Carboxypeptidase regulatory-like domain